MAKKPTKNPKCDEPHEDDAVSLEAPALADGEIYVDLLTDDGIVSERVVISESAKGFKIICLGKWWEHVSEHADGTWQYKAL